VGVPLPGVTVRIINPDTLEEMPHGTDGEVSAGCGVQVLSKCWSAVVCCTVLRSAAWGGRCICEESVLYLFHFLLHRKWLCSDRT
jgi:acyl-CoA synthetase (AMP-forming)/AMP-acid ligase II